MREAGRLGGSGLLLGPMGVLAKHKCPECGKVFECGSQWGYMRRNGDGNRAYYCSYRCYRVEGRKDEERERERIAREDEQVEKREAYIREYGAMRYQSRKASRSRAEQCRERIAHFAALAAMLPLRSVQRRNAQENAARWRRKLAECEAEGGAGDGPV